ncbi:MAG: hypothetical protein JWO57_2523 [Pseudonocardiales bacterium]|nr:hypothetical protein [Pseudonocardiales bacterium]
MTTYEEIVRNAVIWQGVLHPSLLVDDVVAMGHRLGGDRQPAREQPVR